MPLNEDIFGVGTTTELIVRWHDTIIVDFDKKNSKTFEQLKSLINGRDLKCFFLKVFYRLERVGNVINNPTIF